MTEKTFYIYEGVQVLYAFKEKQPEYLMSGCIENKCISVDKDIDSYIYFIQHQSDVLKKENEELSRKLEMAKKIAKEAIQRIDCLPTCRSNSDSWLVKCSCGADKKSKELREALKELE